MRLAYTVVAELKISIKESLIDMSYPSHILNSY